MGRDIACWRTWKFIIRFKVLRFALCTLLRVGAAEYTSDYWITEVEIFTFLLFWYTRRMHSAFILSHKLCLLICFQENNPPCSQPKCLIPWISCCFMHRRSGGYKMPPLSLECNSGMLQVLFTFLEQLPAFLFYSSLMEKWTRLFIVHFNRCYSCWHLLSILELVVSRTCNWTCPLQVKWHWIMPTRRGGWGFCRLRVLWLFANRLLSNI